MIASLKAHVKDLEEENAGLRNEAVVAEKGEERAKKREMALNNYQAKGSKD